MSEIRIGFTRPDEFSTAPTHQPDANSRIHHPVTYHLENEEIASEVREDETLVVDETEISNDTILELDTLTPLE